MSEPGTRVGAWLSSTADEVQLLGYGVYVGDEVPPIPTGPLAQLVGGETWEEFDRKIREEWSPRVEGDSHDPSEYHPTAPKIVLDDGAIVWGYECWWGPEDKMREAIRGRRVLTLTLTSEHVDKPTPDEECFPPTKRES